MMNGFFLLFQIVDQETKTRRVAKLVIQCEYKAKTFKSQRETNVCSVNMYIN